MLYRILLYSMTLINRWLTIKKQNYKIDETVCNIVSWDNRIVSVNYLPKNVFKYTYVNCNEINYKYHFYYYYLLLTITISHTFSKIQKLYIYYSMKIY